MQSEIKESKPNNETLISFLNQGYEPFLNRRRFAAPLLEKTGRFNLNKHPQNFLHSCPVKISSTFLNNQIGHQGLIGKGGSLGIPGGLITTGGRGIPGARGGGKKHPAANTQTRRTATKRPKNFLVFMGSFLSENDRMN